MSIRQAAINCWSAGVVVAALASFATAQAKEAAPQAAPAFSVLYFFDNGGVPSGGAPKTAVTPVGDGGYYGTTSTGGAHGFGTVYKLSADGQYTVLYDFTDVDGDSLPLGAVILDGEGNLYGTTYGASGTAHGATIYKLTPAGEHTVLHQFLGTNRSEGSALKGGLVGDGDGNLYGTAFSDGGNPCACGVIFRLAPDGTYTVLHSFVGTDGSHPTGTLVRDRVGNLYGTTINGGLGYGTVFKLDRRGVLTVLYAFAGGSDGEAPNGDLVRDADGNFYGTTQAGGGTPCNYNGAVGCGTVFKLTPGGTKSLVYAFQDGADGQLPPAGLYRNPQTGALYGTTSLGGDLSCSSIGCGTIFVIKPDGTKQTLHLFNSYFGAGPGAPLVRGQGRDLIGTTGGARKHAGTIFRIRMTQ